MPARKQTSKPSSPKRRSTSHRRKGAAKSAEDLNYEAEAKKFIEEARGASYAADMQKIFLDREAEQRAMELAADEMNRVFVFDDEVSERSVKECIQTLTNWARQDPECDIEIIMNSPGGSIVDGFELVDFLRFLRDRGHEITIVALGMAASMAGVILQAASKRVMGRNCLLLIHEGSFGAIGDYAEVKDRVKMMELFHERILDLFAERAQPLNKKTTKSFIKNRWSRKDWWMSAEDALKHGFVDEVR